jgi:glycosyltransferase involved in cell wall biosynthesis
MRVAVVAPGSASAGGEALWRRVAERLARHHDVEALTTGAADVECPVRRFAAAGEDGAGRRGALRDRILIGSLSDDEERELMRLEGPHSPDLLRYLEEEARAEFGAFVFFDYRAHTTYAGLPSVGARSIFAPGASDEPLLYLRSMDDLFRATPFLIFHSAEEASLAARRFNLESGAGRIAAPPADRTEPAEDAGRMWIERAAGRPIVACAGALGEDDGWGEAREYFRRYASEPGRPEAVLAMTGENGGWGRKERAALLGVADVAIAPSATDSAALAAVEAMRRGVPVLANGRCAAAAGHCVRSNGGLWYRNYAEFADALELLLGRAELRRALGQAAAEYAARWCADEESDAAYLEMLDRIAAVSADA